MNYRHDDLLRLVRAVPFMRLMRAASALALLTRAADDAEELAPVLGRYPQVRYQALDFHYVCLQSLGALSDELVEDLVNEPGWRGLVWACMLACLAPAGQYRRVLAAARGRESRQDWAVDLALAHLGDPCPPELSGLVVQLGRLGRALSTCARPEVVLRPAVTGVELRRAWVRAEYRRGGIEAALQAVRVGERIVLAR